MCFSFSLSHYALFFCLFFSFCRLKSLAQSSRRTVNIWQATSRAFTKYKEIERWGSLKLEERNYLFGCVCHGIINARVSERVCLLCSECCWSHQRNYASLRLRFLRSWGETKEHAGSQIGRKFWHWHVSVWPSATSVRAWVGCPCVYTIRYFDVYMWARASVRAGKWNHIYERCRFSLGSCSQAWVSFAP